MPDTVKKLVRQTKIAAVVTSDNRLILQRDDRKSCESSGTLACLYNSRESKALVDHGMMINEGKNQNASVPTL